MRKFRTSKWNENVTKYVPSYTCIVSRNNNIHISRNKTVAKIIIKNLNTFTAVLFFLKENLRFFISCQNN